MTKLSIRALAPLAVFALLSGRARAQRAEPPPNAEPPAATPMAEPPPQAAAPEVPVAPAVPTPKPPPYSLPWQLRPVLPGNVVRSDTAFGFYQSKTTRGGLATASMLLFSYKVLPELAPLVRLGLVNNAAPDDKSARNNVLNPVLGALYGPKLDAHFKLGLFLGVTLPIGSGGGDHPPAAAGPANQAGAAARSMFDNAMFAVNYLTVFPGVGVAYLRSGFTLQAEATLFQLEKTRGPAAADKSNTNFTTGVHAGYFPIPELSVGAELRYQRWLSTPTSPNVKADKTGTLRDNTTFAVGPRAHVKLGHGFSLHPGVAVAVPLDDPLAYGPTHHAAANSHFKMLQIDVPFVF
ncbi:MAG TPA: hypothetical protein VMI54_19375 [Polyangiaceae bacterium]|nr:hypothetical protein [Polyangiaceae bacterium]